jgi:spermidine/putrescine transport system permease protein
MFLNHMIDNDVALENFSFTGYQPALSVVTPEKMVADEYVTETWSARSSRRRTTATGSRNCSCPRPATGCGRRVGEVQGGPLTVGAPLAPGAPAPGRAARDGAAARAAGGLWAACEPGTLWLLGVPRGAVLRDRGRRVRLPRSAVRITVPEWDPRYWDPTTFVEAVRSTVAGDLRPSSCAPEFVVSPCAAACHRLPDRVLPGPPRRPAPRAAAGLILAPWWINYLTRMLAWLSLLQDDGYVNDVLTRCARARPVQWLSGQPYT